jgi:hypothetical protein
MTALFSSPKEPTPPAQPPTIDEALQAQDAADRIRRRRGAASTVLVKDPVLGGGSQQQQPQGLATVLG